MKEISMKEIAKITKTKKGYVLKDEIWRMMPVKTHCGYLPIEIMSRDFLLNDEVCAICGGVFGRIARIGPWVFASFSNPICVMCIKEHLPNLLPELNKQRTEWQKRSLELVQI